MWRTATTLSVERNARHVLCTLIPTQECLLQARVGELPTVATHRDAAADFAELQQQKYSGSTKIIARGSEIDVALHYTSVDSRQRPNVEDHVMIEVMSLVVRPKTVRVYPRVAKSIKCMHLRVTPSC